jgi:hypothetical protein
MNTTKKRKLEQREISHSKEDVSELLEKIIPPISSETMKEQYDMWCETRDESSRTPRSFHSPISSFNERVNDLLKIFQSNLSTIITLMEKFIKVNRDSGNDMRNTIIERLDVIKSIKGELNNDIISLYETKPSEEDVTAFVNAWFHKILDLLRDNQPYINHIQIVLSRNKKQGRIQFIPIPENTTNSKHTLILFFFTHGTYGNNYPSLLAVPSEKNVCKTTLTLPGCVAFNSPSQLNEIISLYETAYGVNDIQDKLQEDFVNTFTDTNNYLKNPILQEITGNLHSTVDNHSEVVQIKYKTWCDSIRGSTSSLMLQTRYNEYIKNKVYGIMKDDVNKNINNIYVLLDTSGRFNPGDKLIDYELTFPESSTMTSGSITLQEIINIFYDNGWYDIGIIDNTCESGNILISHAENFPGILSNRGLPHIRGGSRKHFRQSKNKKSKKNKRNKGNKTRRKNKNRRK